LNETIILDTKWKNLTNKGKTYGISQSDIYQMYAYGKKYNNVNKIYLIYPYNDEFKIQKQASEKITKFLPVKEFDNIRFLGSGFKFEDDGENNKEWLELNILLWDLARITK
ncbi:MAG: hypothetical protein KGY75_10700, partial [Candidatus Cloacimonetes bacterium]|nr:hypothetical protein [Candidatus Cloacimonadota bacterium]